MGNSLNEFKKYAGQTSDFPIGLEISGAEGVYLYDTSGNKYMDLISGLSVNNIGHRNPEVVSAIKEQADRHLHVMVYGEFVQNEQLKLARNISELLPEELSKPFLVNSGSEAVEGALKLSKRFTGRREIISFNKAYHGGTQGALSLMGDEEYRRPFRPLLPGVRRLSFNSFDQISEISENTACVIVEPIQAEGGIITPERDFLDALREKCNKTGTLLIFDEVQTGFGRTGSMFAFQTYKVIPDIIVLGKALGAGMPVAAFCASEKIMSVLKKDPVLGHITTFGGHPVACAAANAGINFFKKSKLIDEVNRKSIIYRKLLKHKEILDIRGEGLFMAVKLKNRIRVKKVLPELLSNGFLSNSFIFCYDSFRIAPPLIISEDEIEESSAAILKVLNAL